MSDENRKGFVTRFAPSPTGALHVGSARTALFNYAFAKQNGGKLVLRIEDTDKERSKKEYEDNILEGLAWLGISHEEMYRQSERGGVYEKYIQKLIDSGAAYVSKEEAKEGQRGEVIRFKNPNKEVAFTDLIRGKITFDTTELGDFVIARDLQSPLYHLAVVVDDFEMGVTHIIRGEDGISNTPRQILIQEAIDAPRPHYAHLPLILAPDRSKLSKRHGAVSVTEFREQGYLPEAMINMLGLLGWHPVGDEDIFTMEEFIHDFSLEKVQKGGAIFNMEKLDWVNKEHLKKLPTADLVARIEEYIPEDIKKLSGYSKERLETIVPLIMERINTLGDVRIMGEGGELSYFFTAPTYAEPEKIVWKKDTPDEAKKHIEKLIELLGSVDEKKFNADTVKDAVWGYAEEVGKGNVLWPLRFTLSGQDKSPDPFTLAEVLGKEETLVRLATTSKLL